MEFYSFLRIPQDNFTSYVYFHYYARGGAGGTFKWAESSFNHFQEHIPRILFFLFFGTWYQGRKHNSNLNRFRVIFLKGFNQKTGIHSTLKSVSPQKFKHAILSSNHWYLMRTKCNKIYTRELGNGPIQGIFSLCNASIYFNSSLRNMRYITF